MPRNILVLLCALLLASFGLQATAQTPETTNDPQALFNKGFELFQAGDYAAADSVLRLYLSSKGEVRDTLYADGAYVLALSLEQQGKYAEALPYLRTTAEIYLAVLGDRNPNYPVCLTNIALNLEYQGLYDVAEPLLRQALEIRKELYGELHPTYALSLYKLATNLGYHGRYNEAEPLLRQALEIHKEVHGELHPEYANVLANLAYNLDNQGRYAEADVLYQKSLELDKELIGENHPNYLTNLKNYSINLYNQGRYSAAILLINRVIRIRKEVLGLQHPDYSSSLGALAMYLTAQGRYSEAELLYRESLNLTRETLGEQHPLFATSLNNLAFNLNSQGRFQEAETLYRQTLALDKESLGERHPYYATGLANLAHNLNAQRSYAEAEPLHRQALEINKEVLTEKNPDFAANLDNLALNLSYQGRYLESEALHRESRRIYFEQLGEFHPYYAKNAANLAENLTAQSRPNEAETLYRQALAIQKEVLGQIHPSYALSLNSLASNLTVQGRLNEAVPLYREALGIYYQHYTANQEGLSEAQRQKLYETGLGSSYREMLLRCADHPELATPGYVWEWHLNLRGLQLQTTTRLRTQVLASGDTALISIFNLWRSQREYLAALYNLTKDELTRRRVDIAAEEAKATDLERDLNRRSEAFALATDTTRIHWQDLQALLKPSEGLVDIARFGSADSIGGYLAFLYRHGWDGPRTAVITDATWLETTGLTRYRRSIAATVGDTSVYSRFWQPIADSLGAVSKLYLATDGVYNQLNLNTLALPSGGYVLDATDVVQVGSFRDLVRPRKQLMAARTVTIVGRPTYQMDTTAFAMAYTTTEDLSRGGVSSSLGGTTWADLPGTEAEARAIAQQFSKKKWTVSLSLGSNATEGALKQLQRPGVLHIATHGFFVPEPESPKVAGTQSTEALAFRSGDLNTANAYNFDRDPMLRSGLVLAGVNNAASTTQTLTDDCILTAFEAVNLDLTGTELVVLSACETGLGKVQAGEGIYGLQRAMQVAGARSVITSLWRVSDSATELLMSDFYGRWLKGTPKREAFRQAQLAVRKQYPEPEFWGAFVLVGE